MGDPLPEERLTPRVGGAALWSRSQGPASAPAILFLDGIGCSGWAFRRIVPALAARYRVVQCHYPGHGRSPEPPRPWRVSIPDLADDAAAVLHAHRIEQAVVVGFSMGFQVALELYRRHRRRVVGLVSLAGPSGQALSQFQGTDVFSQLLPWVQGAARHAQELTLRVWRRVLPSRWLPIIGLHTQLNPMRIELHDLEFYLDQMAAMNPELFLEMLAEASRHVADDLLPWIRVPTLVVAGAHDRFVPAEVLRSMAFAIPSAQWMLLRDSSHALPAEFAAEMAVRLGQFADEIYGQPPD